MPKTLERLLDFLEPETRVCLCREMTKKFEEFIRGSVKEVYEKIKEKPIKGEIVLLVN